MRKRMGSFFIAAALLAVLMPAASADVCFGCPGSGGGGGTGTSPFNHLSISNGGPTAATQPVQEDENCFFTIHRANPKGKTTTVHWHTKDGTATSTPESPPPGADQGGVQGSPPDYDAASGVATFNSEQPRNITISVHTEFDDSPPEETSEYFFVVISHPVNGVIVDNKGKCFIAQPTSE